MLRFLFTHVERRVGLRGNILIDLSSRGVIIQYVIFVVGVKSVGLGADGGTTDGENL